MKNQIVGLIDRCSKRLNDFKNRQNGATALEYAVIVAGLTLIFIAIFHMDGPFHHAMKDLLKGSTDGIMAALNNIL